MDFLKALFESGALTWEQFTEAVTEKGYKLADLSTGNYVGKKKYDDEIATKDATIAELNGQIVTRDSDLETLKADLQKANQDGEGNANIILELNNKIAGLQTDYDNAKKDYEAKLSHQEYEFAVKEFVGTKSFSSAAAKRDFERAILDANLTVKDNSLIGAEDFVALYQKDNADAFKTEGNPEPDPKPTFIHPTPPNPTPAGSDNPFIQAFNFAGN